MKINQQIDRMISRTAAEVAELVKANIRNEVGRLIGSNASTGVRVYRANGRTKAKRVILCPVLNCGKPGGGPKFGWFCRDHKDLSASEKAKARKLRKKAT